MAVPSAQETKVICTRAECVNLLFTGGSRRELQEILGRFEGSGIRGPDDLDAPSLRVKNVHRDGRPPRSV